MDTLVNKIINSCWIIFLIVWLLAAIFTKRTVYRESRTQRLGHMIPILTGCYLLSHGYDLSYPFNVRIIPQTNAILMAAAILCVCGVSFCVWARIVLGQNWSGTVTLKEHHELIVDGPYRLVRHPIYTGLLAMIVGTMMELGHLGGIIGFLLVLVSLWVKSSHEEELMCQQFPDQYPGYQDRVRRIIPFVL